MTTVTKTTLQLLSVYCAGDTVTIPQINTVVQASGVKRSKFSYRVIARILAEEVAAGRWMKSGSAGRAEVYKRSKQNG